MCASVLDSVGVLDISSHTVRSGVESRDLSSLLPVLLGVSGHAVEWVDENSTRSTTRLSDPIVAVAEHCV